MELNLKTKKAKVLIAGLGAVAYLSFSSPAHAQATDLDELEPRLSIEFTEDFIVGDTHTHNGEAHTHNADGSHSHEDDIDQALIDDIEEISDFNLAVHALASSGPEAIANTEDLTELESQIANINGGIFVTFDNESQIPADVRNIVQAAVADVDSRLQTNPNGPVEILFSWESFNSQSVLGFGGPEALYRTSQLPSAEHAYPAALTNTLLGLDANGSARPELIIGLNSDLYANDRWYVSTGNNPSFGQIDLYSVVLHEAIHGLGFSGAPIDQGSGPSYNGFSTIYDSLVEFNNQPVLNLSNPDSTLQSNNLFIDTGNEDYKLYAPSTWQQGSSYSHFDEATYRFGQPGSLMTPVITSSATERSLDGPILDVLGQLGWSTIEGQDDPVNSGDDSDNGNTGSNSGNTGGNTDSSGSGTNNGGNTGGTNTNSGNSGGSTNTNPLAIDVPDTALDGQIARLYRAYFLRAPDASGFRFWKNQRASGTSAKEISDFFSNSPEFNRRYGQLSNAEFVRLIYRNVLRRSPDQSGFNFWVNTLNSGVSRGEVMLGFSDSIEYVRRTETVAPNGIDEGQVLRLYRAAFLRSPGDSALAFWTNSLQTEQLDNIAEFFTQSPEFNNRYGALSDREFVTLVYRNVLRRSPRQSEVDFWAGQLFAGASRGEVLVGFSESLEFKLRTGIL